MKKKITALTLIGILAAATLLTACGASEDYAPTMNSGGSTEVMMRAEAYDMDYYGTDADYAYSEETTSYPAPEAANPAGSGIIPITAPVTGEFAEKIIYSYSADIETLDFDETISNVNMLITTHRAFIENSNISGNNYESYSRGGVSYRYAYYVIRVPVTELNAITSKLDTLGNIVSQSSYAQNITAQFTDQESRLNSLRIQEERLLEMLKKAEKVEDMITIENSLTDIRYQIENITSNLTNWQRQVDYSTLSLTIQEVEEYKEIVPIQRSYWEKMGDGIMSTLRGVGSFFSGLFMWLVVSAPVLIILAIIAVAVVIIVKRKIRKNAAKPKKVKYPYTQAPAGNMQYQPAETQQNPIYCPQTPDGASIVTEETVDKDEKTE